MKSTCNVGVGETEREREERKSECSEVMIGSSGFRCEYRMVVAVMMQCIKQLFIQLYVRHVIINAVNGFWIFPSNLFIIENRLHIFHMVKLYERKFPKIHIANLCGQLENDHFQCGFIFEILNLNFRILYLILHRPGARIKILNALIGKT